MNKLKKQNFNYNKVIAKQIKNINHELRSLSECELVTITEIKKLYNELEEESIDSILKSIDIEELNRNKEGIRVSALKNEGIYNMYQLHRLSYSDLLRIKNIGEGTVNKIVSEEEHIYKNVKENIKVRVEVNNPTQVSIKLIKNIHFLRNIREDLQKCEKAYRDNRTFFQDHIKKSKVACSRIKWLFSSKDTKNTACEAIEVLDDFLNSPYLKKLMEITLNIKNCSEIDEYSCWEDFKLNASAYYSEMEFILGIKLDSEKTTGGLSLSFIEKIESQPINLKMMKATLRNYQLFGSKYIINQKNTLLGDEMGLGKTIQALAAMSDLSSKGQRHFLVICPLSVLSNWCREIERHSKLEAVAIHGTKKKKELEKWIEHGGVGVTTFGTIGSLGIDELNKPDKISMLVVDEAHYIKNPKANRTQNVIDLLNRAEVKLFLTGTPIENNVDEMYQLINYLNPVVANQIETVRHLSRAREFRRKVEPVYLRRIRDDVLTELPDLEEINDWNTLEKFEFAAYKKSVMSGSFMDMRRVSWQVDDINKSTKAKRLMEICDKAFQNERKVIIYSYFLDTLNQVESLLGDKVIGKITGKVSSKNRQMIIDDFTASQSCKALLCQSQSGGVGLNIQCASVVVFCEPQLKPSTEEQAKSRVYRMGQTQNVTVYKLLMENSIDERIMEILDNKQFIFDRFAEESNIGKNSIQQMIEKEQNLCMNLN